MSRSPNVLRKVHKWPPRGKAYNRYLVFTVAQLAKNTYTPLLFVHQPVAVVPMCYWWPSKEMKLDGIAWETPRGLICNRPSCKVALKKYDDTTKDAKTH
eukprot:scaffold715_cov217-Chaetoceros_neogracile.AAC.4